MEQLIFDDGAKEYQVNGGAILRFNPCDPNLYHRFFKAMEQIDQLAQEYVKDIRVQSGEMADENGFPKEPVALAATREHDRKAKEILSEVFGKCNDFDNIFNGMNILAIANNQMPIITNFLNALSPIVQNGAKQVTKSRVDAAVEQAKQDRLQRETLT